MSYPAISITTASIEGLPWKTQKAAGAPETAQKAAAAAAPESDYWGADGFGFSDLLDIINPLQHVPFVSDIYRDLTGDETTNGARSVGGFIFGGAIGFAASVINSTAEAISGKTLTGHMVAFAGDMFGGGQTEIAADAPRALAYRFGDDNDREYSPVTHAELATQPAGEAEKASPLPVMLIENRKAQRAYESALNLPSRPPEEGA